MPVAINNKFNSDYPNMHAAWSISGQNYRADYTDGSLDRSITYNRNGAIISREEELANDNYPVAIRSYFARHYPNEQCEVWSKMDSAGNRNYYVSRTTETVWFDRNGKYRHTMKTGGVAKLQPEDH